MRLPKPRVRRSLRSIFVLWLLLFSILPLAFLTGYSLIKYESALSLELSERLSANAREIQTLVRDFESQLRVSFDNRVTDTDLIRAIENKNYEFTRIRAKDWITGSRLSVFDDTGRLQVSLYKDEKGFIQRDAKIEGKDFYLKEAYLSSVQGLSSRFAIYFLGNNSMDLVVFAPVRNAKRKTVGYIEELIRIDEDYLKQVKARLGLEIAFVANDGERVLATFEDLKKYKTGFYYDQKKIFNEQPFELSLRGDSHLFRLWPIYWGDQEFLLALGVSKKSSEAVLDKIKNTFLSVVGTIILLLIALSFFISNVVLRPLREMLARFQTTDFDKDPVLYKTNSNTEFDVLNESFNEMVKRIYATQKALRENIKKVEEANQEILATQEKLVHSEKMASLGQLVAGVAHELNNPIGFIYSNMAHLREYSETLLSLLATAEKNVSNLKVEKEKADFDYLVKDLPKLIKSCEDGAKRTKEIVLALRNFSRLDEAKLKEVDIHEGIESTLSLLSGELKQGVVVEKNYGVLPMVTCYPSQLNQVFMNILSNAIQATNGKGKITITTKTVGKDRVMISIADDGPGMSPEVSARVFDPFFTTKDVDQGTGLGMSISFGIVERHRGRISVRSELGKGAAFDVELPVTLVPSVGSVFDRKL
jgi:two-component system NtrC family sensor kinase